MKAFTLVTLVVGLVGVAVVGLVWVTGGAVICLFAPCDAPPVSISGELRAEDGGALPECRLQVVAPPQKDKLFVGLGQPRILQDEPIGASFETGFQADPFIENYQVVIRCPGFEIYEGKVFARRSVIGKRKLFMGAIAMRREAASSDRRPANHGLNPARSGVTTLAQGRKRRAAGRAG